MNTLVLLIIIHSVVTAALIVLLVIFYLKSRMLKNLRSMVNHDLRSPLNAILGFSDLLLQTEKDDEKIKFLTAINSGGKTLLSTLEEVAHRLKKKYSPMVFSGIREIPERRIFSGSLDFDNSKEPQIMIVDDFSENIDFLENILQKSGFRTVSASSGEQAIELLKEHTPDLVLLDIVMPGLSGFETCAKIQSNRDFIDIPVIFLSAKKDEKTIIESFIYGGIDYVVKPFNSPELLARVNTHLQLKSAKEKLNILAFSDSLTGLYNRRKIIETLDHEMARSKRYGENMSFIMIDIDLFKKVNDTYGHDIGDKALIRFAEIVSSSLRETDFAGRLGGEEFGIILPQTNREQAMIVAERIRSRIEKEAGNKAKGIPAFTASFGVAEYEKKNISSDLLTQKADKALYRAKELGRNRVECFIQETAE